MNNSAEFGDNDTSNWRFGVCDRPWNGEHTGTNLVMISVRLVAW